MTLYANEDDLREAMMAQARRDNHFPRLPCTTGGGQTAAQMGERAAINGRPVFSSSTVLRAHIMGVLHDGAPHTVSEITLDSRCHNTIVRAELDAMLADGIVATAQGKRRDTVKWVLAK